jgi:hypothetical protein
VPETTVVPPVDEKSFSRQLHASDRLPLSNFPSWVRIIASLLAGLTSPTGAIFTRDATQKSTDPANRGILIPFGQSFPFQKLHEAKYLQIPNIDNL